MPQPKKALFVLSEYGYWGEELIGPLEKLEEAGYQIDFITNNGKRAHALPPSFDPTYIDPPLGRPVTSKEMADKVKKIEASTKLDKPLNLTALMPGRPYYSAPNWLVEFEKYQHAADEAAAKLVDPYATIVLVGGSGPIVDMVNNRRLHDLVLGFLKAGKPIAAECYGVAVLAFARDIRDRHSIIWGKRVTGHCIEYDYHDGTGFLGTDLNMGPPPYPLEYILRDATGPDGAYVGNFGREISAIVDYPFITGRSTADSYKTGELLVGALEKGLRRYGW